MSEDNKIINVDLSTTKDVKGGIMRFFANPLVVSLIIIIIAGGAIIFGINKFKAPDLPQASDKEIAFGELNNPKVTFEVYEDFICPHCNQFNSIYKTLEENYKDKSVKFVFRNYPFLASNSRTAAEASEYAYDKDKFNEFKDKVFEEQTKAYDAAGAEDPSFASLEKLVSYGEAVGLDGKDLRANLEGRAYKTRVQNELDAAKTKGINSTPTVFINNEEYKIDASKEQYLDVDSLSKKIDELLNK